MAPCPATPFPLPTLANQSPAAGHCSELPASQFTPLSLFTTHVYRTCNTGAPRPVPHTVDTDGPNADKLFTREREIKQGVVAYICNPSARVQVKSELHVKTCLDTITTRKTTMKPRPKPSQTKTIAAG